MKNILTLNIEHNRIFGLDILRSIAIILVVFGHGDYILPNELDFFQKLFAWDGVSIFFVLSGFLIGGILIKNLEINKNKNFLLNFWMRRWLRTLPLYFLILSILIALSAIFHKENELNPLYFIFSQNFDSPHPNFFPEAWSLSVEEWFYLIVPLLIVGLLKVFKIETRKGVLVTVCIILLLSTSFRFSRYLTIDLINAYEWDKVFRKQVVTRLDSIMFGVLGAYISYYYNSRWIRYRKALLALGISIFLLMRFFEINGDFNYNSLYASVFNFSITSLATLMLLPFLSTYRRSKKGTVFKTITYISLISYSMYLIHLSLIQRWIIKRIIWEDLFTNRYLEIPVMYSFYWGLTLLFSVLLYKYFEIPFMNLRENTFIKRIMSTDKLP